MGDYMEMYGAFAAVYDRMQYDVDYNRWIQKIHELVKSYNPGAKRMLELACGTGTIGIGLSKQGYIVEGLDLSEDMLAVAQSKAYDSGVKMRFYHQDMSQFQTKKKYDVIFCMCDGLNYIVDDDQMADVFEAIYNHLTPEGLLIFDISSHYKLSKVIGNKTFAETFETEAYIWENEFDQTQDLLSFTLTLFVEEDDGYQRYEEYHQQRAYKVEEMVAFSSRRFEMIQIADGDTFEELNQKSNRIGFVLKPKSV